MSLRIARIEAADIAALVRLNGVVQDHHVRMRPDVFRSDWRPLALRAFWAAVLEDRTSTVALAKLDGDAVGYVWFQLHENPQNALKYARRRIYVHQIAVQEGTRRAGVGKHLLEYAEAEARRLGITTIALDTWAANDSARAFFGSVGYEPTKIFLTKTVGSP